MRHFNKNRFISMVILIGCIIIVSCSKDEDIQRSPVLLPQSITYHLNNVPMDKYAVGPSKSATITDIKTLMSNPDDADDEKINNYLYEISLATRDLVKDRVFN